METLKYSEWNQTARTLHMIFQIVGKTRLALTPAQPEWGNVRLFATPRGLTSGVMTDGGVDFDVTVDLIASDVTARRADGRTAGFSLRDGASVADYYADFTAMLRDLDCCAPISPVPQEVADATPFDQQLEKWDYDARAAKTYLDNCLFARRALTKFASPYRGKKLLPALFWGTFDMTAVLFSGVSKPFSGGGIVEQVAFDEQFVEFGLWPGDDTVDDPSFFVLPYPFLTQDLSGASVSPAEAFFSEEKKEFFLPLAAVLAHDDPEASVVQFCTDAFDAVAKAENWANTDWLTKPLLV